MAKSPAELLIPNRPLTLASVADGAEGLVIADLARAIAARPLAPATSLLVICREGPRMAALTRALSFFAPDIDVLELPAWDCQPYDRVSPHATIVAQRMAALSRLARIKGRTRPAVVLSTEDHHQHRPDVVLGLITTQPPEPVAPEGSGWLGAVGGIYSTPGDLTKWDLALMNGKLLKPDSWKLMTTSRQLINGKETGYGCGLVVAVQEHRAVLRHGGAVSGFNAFNALVPSTKSAVVLLSNKDGGLGSLPDTLTGLLLKEESNVPKIAGAPAAEIVKKVFAELQAGKVDRTHLGEEFNIFLTDEKIASAAKRLKPLGKPKSVDVQRSYERGGMEVTITRLKFDSRNLEVLMYRMPNGRIEQFFVDEK
jgi:hypothetical protein